MNARKKNSSDSAKQNQRVQTGKRNFNSLVNRSTLDKSETLQGDIPLTDSRATTNNLLNILVDGVTFGTMTNKLVLGQTRAGYENLLRVEPTMTTFYWSTHRVAVNQTQKPVESAAFFAEIIENSISLICVTIKPL